MADATKPYKTNKEILKVIDEFSELYSKIIEKLYGQKSREFLNNVKRALKGIRQLKHDIGKHDKVFYAEVNFKKEETRCAYVYAYSVLNTAIVYSEFLKCLEPNEDVFREVFSKESLNLCCLAGGPATEAVAISKAINDFIEKLASDATQLFTNVNVTVVDICPEWGSEANAVVNALNNTTSLFRSRKVSFHIDFLAADLFNPISRNNIQDKIKEANIVTLVKFSSAVLESSETDSVTRIKEMVESVIKYMDYGSSLFMLDAAGGSMVNKVMSVTKTVNISSSKCQFSLHNEYRLPIKVLLKMEEAIRFKRFFPNDTIIPTHLTKVSSSLWIKKPLCEKTRKAKKAAKKNEQ